MNKKLVSGLFWVLLLNIIVKPLWILGIEVGVQNAVGAEAYGFYFSIFNFAYIFNILLDLGITNFNTRNIAQHPHLINKHFGGILTIKLLLLALYLVVTFTVGLLIGYNSKQFALLAILTFNQFLNSLILYLRSNFEGLLLFKWDSVLSVLDRLLMIVICGVLLLNTYTRSHFKIEYFVLAQTAAYLITTIVALAALLHSRHSHALKLRLRFNKPFSLAILKQSAPFALLVLLMASYNRIDPVLLQRLLPDGDYQAGIYASAFRLLDALTMIAYLFSVPLLPIYSRLVKKETQNPNEIAETTKSMFSLVWVFSITAAITLSSMATPLMELLYTEHTETSAQVFRILIYGIIPISFTYVFGTLLTANGNLKQLNIFAALSLLINIGCNLWLIPRYAATGSAWASLIAQSFMALTQMVAAFRIFHFRISFDYLWRLLLFLVIVGCCNFIHFSSLWWHLLFVGIVALINAILLFDFNLKKFISPKIKA
ncbi:MAG: oligosaccharide flippase family protein [Bacteroidales bacterium]|nr:oligosaccharide flippase family protein [Candidatus Colimorpha pelethequi]